MIKLYFTLIFTGLFVGQLDAQIPTNGLIACYDFDGNTNDGIGSFDGTLGGGASANGTLNVGMNATDYLSVPGTIFNNINEFSIAHNVIFTDFNVNNASSSNVIFSGASAANDNLMNFAYAKDQLPGGSTILQNTVFYIYNNTRYEFNNIDLSAGVSYHFTLVRGVNTLQLYIDGVEQSPIGGHTVPTFNLTLDPAGFIFGQDQDVLAGGFQSFQSLNGALDDLLIYDRELTGQEVVTISTLSHSELAVDELFKEKMDVEIFPNPSNGQMTVRLHNNSSTKLTIEAYDLNGQIVYNLSEVVNTEDNSFTLDFSNFEQGKYMLVISDEKSQIVKEVLVSR